MGANTTDIRHVRGPRSRVGLHNSTGSSQPRNHGIQRRGSEVVGDDTLYSSDLTYSGMVSDQFTVVVCESAMRIKQTTPSLVAVSSLLER